VSRFLLRVVVPIAISWSGLFFLQDYVLRHIGLIPMSFETSIGATVIAAVTAAVAIVVHAIADVTVPFSRRR
jgi:hypothetical protein